GFVSPVAILPAGDVGQSGPEIPARLLVEAGFRFVGTASGRHQEHYLHWRSEPHTLQAWRARNGALLAEALRQACDSLAVQFREAAERLWRGGQ
ncbi:MAG TPA: hypothetical protein VFP00_10315, partial [Burkholderiales bacterium]|nr:hypothetical protein [Burkholderiales bacterium]